MLDLSLQDKKLSDSSKFTSIGSMKKIAILSNSLLMILLGQISSAYAADAVIMPVVGNQVVGDQVVVGGLVQKPGPIKWNEGMTIWKAILDAGGPNEFGDLSNVRLFRDGTVRTYDLTEKKNLDIPLKPHDTIEVPQLPQKD